MVNGVLEATGLLKGTMTDANGTKLGTVSQTATMPVNTSAPRRQATPPTPPWRATFLTWCSGR